MRAGGDKQIWQDGEHVIVTGDTASWGHHFAEGQEVVVIAWTEGDGYECQDLEVGSIAWWVHVQDLKPAVVPVTDEEMDAVLKSLGVQS